MESFKLQNQSKKKPFRDKHNFNNRNWKKEREREKEKQQSFKVAISRKPEETWEPTFLQSRMQ